MDKLPYINVVPIDHCQQRYDTAGDYKASEFEWNLFVSECADWRHTACLMLHELVEMCLTKNNGVDWKDIDAFDMTGLGKDNPDPGSLPEAPYHKEHKQAEILERRFAKMLGVSWAKYNEALDALEYKYE